MFQPRYADPRRREGELMWAARFDERAVQELERLLGRFGAAGQLGQRPAPRGGGIVTREDFCYYRSVETPGDFDLVVISVDAAFKEVQTASYVVIQAWGRSPPNSYLLAQTRDHMSFTKTLIAIRAMRTRFTKVNAILIEDKANGPAIIDVLKRSIPGVLPEEPRGSKPARAEAAAPLFHSKNVWVPHYDEQPWVEGFISEWCAVPTNAFWDQVDASDQYLNKYGRAMRASLGDAMTVGGVGGVGESAATEAGSPWGSYGNREDSAASATLGEGSPWS